MSSLKRLFGQILPFIDQVLVSGGNFLTVVLVSRSAPVEEVGKLGLLLAVYVGGTLLIASTIFQWASVIAPRQRAPEKYFFSLLCFQIIQSIVYAAFMAAVFFLIRINAGWKLNGLAIIVSSIYIFLQMMSEFFRRSAYIFSSVYDAIVISSFSFLLKTSLLFVLAPKTFFEIVLILIASLVLPSIYGLYYILKRRLVIWSNTREVVTFLSEHWKGARSLTLSGVLAWIASVSPRFLLGAFHGMSPVANLTALNSISRLTNLLLEVLDTSVSATASKLYVSSRNHYNRYLYLFLVISFLIWGLVFVLFLVVPKSIVGIVLGPKYIPVAYVLPILWVESGLRILFRFSALKARTMGFPHIQLMGFVAYAATMYVLGLPLVILYSLTGTVWAMNISAAANAFVIFLGLRWLSRKEYKK